jgi:hypothetical protein
MAAILPRPRAAAVNASFDERFTNVEGSPLF